MLADAAVVAVKDLRIEARSRVGVNQVMPFAFLILVLFAIALDADRAVLQRVGPGLFWIAVLFSCVLAVQRSFSIETSDSARDRLRLSGFDPAGIFLGKLTALVAQLLLLELVLTIGIVFLFDVELSRGGYLVASAALATIGLSAAATMYGLLAADLRMNATLLPILLLPVAAPVLLAATRVWESAFTFVPGQAGSGLQFLAVFAAIYVALGVVAFGTLLEDQ